jgi:preprotein translocase subunit SecA
VIYKTKKEKYEAVIDEIIALYEKGQPVLVGTVSIEKSERLSGYLTRRGIPHEVLNAKNHEREAAIIAQAGRFGAVTVATNMAGRGVDIQLGGNPEELAKMEMKKRGIDPEDPGYEEGLAEALTASQAEARAGRERVLEQGGLYVLGTERHESRRIDNQLRGRSGRQGDPGESRFYLSLEDDLMRRFASDRVAAIMRRFRIPEDVPIEAKMVTNSIERAQRQVESQNFEIRKNVLKYDEVMNRQREVVYEWRSTVLQGRDTEGLVREWIDEVVAEQVESAISDDLDPGDWNWDELARGIDLLYPSRLGRVDLAAGDPTVAEAVEAYQQEAQEAYSERAEELGVGLLRSLERTVVLSIVDAKWREHLAEMDYLRSGIGLRAMGQKDPLVEYQREAYDMFADMVGSIKQDSVRYLFRAQIVERPAEEQPRVRLQSAGGQGPSLRRQASAEGKVGRNDPCPCGSGKKYKKCHGAHDAA